MEGFAVILISFRRTAPLAAGLALVFGALAFTAQRAESAGTYPSKPVTIVVPVKPGGGADKYSRSFAKFLGKELGVPVKVVNKPGAGSMIGTKYYMKMPSDGYSLLFQMMPHIGNTILVRGADYKIDDFIFINHPAQDYSAMFTSRKKPAAQSIEQFLQKIRKNKGKVSIAVQKASAGYINLVLMLKALKMSEDDVKIITYNSGGPLRNAIAGAHVDAGLIAGYNSVHMKDLFKPLLVFRKDRSPNWDAPAYPELLKKYGATSDMMPGTIRGLAIRRSVRDRYPERYKILVKAMEKTVKDPKVVAHMKKTLMPYEWLGPEESTRRIRSAYKKYNKYVYLFKKKKKK